MRFEWGVPAKPVPRSAFARRVEKRGGNDALRSRVDVLRALGDPYYSYLYYMLPCRSVEFETLGARRQSDARGGAADTQQALTELLVQARSRNTKC